MAINVQWTPEAEETYDAIINYLEGRWSDKEVRFFVRATLRVLSQIENNSFQFKESSLHQVRVALVTKHNSLFYFFNEESKTVILYTFWDNRRDSADCPY